MTPEGRDLVTTLPAATKVRSPMVTPLSTLTFTPNQTSFSIIIGASEPVRGSFMCQSVSVIKVLAPHRTFSPIVIRVALLITVPLKPEFGPISIFETSVNVEMIHGRLTPIRLETEDDLNVQPVPMLIWLRGCLKNRARPKNEQPGARCTPHQHAASCAQNVCTLLLAMRTKQSTTCGRLSLSINFQQ